MTTTLSVKLVAAPYGGSPGTFSITIHNDMGTHALVPAHNIMQDPEFMLDYYGEFAAALGFRFRACAFTRAIAKDFEAEDKKYTRYHKLWAKRCIRAMKKSAKKVQKQKKAS